MWDKCLRVRVRVFPAPLGGSPPPPGPSPSPVTAPQVSLWHRCMYKSLVGLVQRLAYTPPCAVWFTYLGPSRQKGCRVVGPMYYLHCLPTGSPTSHTSPTLADQTRFAGYCGCCYCVPAWVLSVSGLPVLILTLSEISMDDRDNLGIAWMSRQNPDGTCPPWSMDMF